MNQSKLVGRFTFVGALSLMGLTAVAGCKGKVDEAPDGALKAAPAIEGVTAAPSSSGAVVALAPGRADPCVAACARSRELRCQGAQQCEATCSHLRDSEPCGAEMRAALGCFVAEPASSWECGEDGMAAIRDGVCVAAQQRVVDCLSASAAH